MSKEPSRNIVTRADSPVTNVNEESRTVDVVFATEHAVRRYDWRNDREFMEVLSFDPSHVDMGRMEKGVAPVLDNHDSWRGAAGAIGVVEGAKLEGNKGVATLRFAKTPDVDNTWEKVRDGILKAVSVGYRVNKYTEDGRHENGLPIYRATSWEPMEVSVAPIPADPDSKGRGLENTDFEITVDQPKKKEKPKRDVAAVNNKSQKMSKVNLNDLKASRKALEDELANLNALTEMDETQEARFEKLVDDIDALNAKITKQERADLILTARAAAGEASSKGEEKEIIEQKKRFNMTDAIRAVVNGKPIEGVVAEWTQEAQRMGVSDGGDISIPQQFMRAGGADDFQAASGDGSGFIATDVGGFIEGLMQPIPVESWGTQVLRGLTGNLKLPRESVNADATAEGEVDSGAASGMEMDDFTLAPNRYYNDTKFSLQLLQTGTGQVDQIVANALRRGHERRIMKDIFTGSAGITGIVGISGVTDIAAADGADYAAIYAELEQSLLENEGLSEGARFILSPSAYRYFTNAVKVSGVEALVKDGMLGGYDLTKTSYLADASSGVGQIIFGDWANAILAYFGAVDITIDPYSAKKTGQIEISMTQFADFNLAQPAAFAFENGVAIS